ncbi:MAG: flagellar biosynthetic protein FliO [Vicinamibacterales bacterium]
MRLLLALQEGIPFAADPAPIGGRAILTAFTVVAVLAALAWWLRRRLPVSRGRQLIAVETAISLGERRSLVIVAVENRRLLIGVTPQQLSLLTDLGPAAMPDGQAFSQALQASLDAGGQQ